MHTSYDPKLCVLMKGEPNVKAGAPEAMSRSYRELGWTPKGRELSISSRGLRKQRMNSRLQRNSTVGSKRWSPQLLLSPLPWSSLY